MMCVVLHELTFAFGRKLRQKTGTLVSVLANDAHAVK